MTGNSWIYDAIVYMYALSLLFYFSDFVGANQKAKRIGSGLLSFVWLLQFTYLAFGVYGGKSFVDFYLLETLLLYSWLLITLSLVIHRFFRIHLFEFLINLLGFAILTLSYFVNPGFSTTINPGLLGDWFLFSHVAMAMASYTAFTVAMVFSGMYLFLHRQLKVKNWSPTVKRIPSLEVIERYMTNAVIVGGSLLFLAIFLGGIRIWYLGDMSIMFDLKVTGSMIVLGVYTLYIIQRFSFRPTGTKLAIWNLGAFAVVMINLFIANYYSAFHRWIH